MMLHTNLKASRPVVLDEKIFPCIPYISLCKRYDPKGGPICGPRGII